MTVSDNGLYNMEVVTAYQMINALFEGLLPIVYSVSYSHISIDRILSCPLAQSEAKAINLCLLHLLSGEIFPFFLVSLVKDCWF